VLDLATLLGAAVIGFSPGVTARLPDDGFGIAVGVFAGSVLAGQIY